MLLHAYLTYIGIVVDSSKYLLGICSLEVNAASYLTCIHRSFVDAAALYLPKVSLVVDADVYLPGQYRRCSRFCCISTSQV